ncbi:hypothetical protein Q5427_12945 [Brochothrix thermosphacta]|nr:hypothetical protein [Brochothrix thermosphacta]MDO7865190.1 hypothetical protein [Brochothrix thermosphacta]
MTVEELARAFEVSVEEINESLLGCTVSISSRGEELVFFSDIELLREKFDMVGIFI